LTSTRLFVTLYKQ